MTSPLSSLTATWNNGATVFAAIKMNVTDTASDAASLLLDLQVASVSQFAVRKDGFIRLGAGDNQFELRGRGSDVAAYGVPYFRSTKTNSPTAFDMMPNGTGGSEVSGKVWFDLCNSDLSPANSNDFQALTLQAHAGELRIGSHAGGTGTHLPLKIGGTTLSFYDFVDGGSPTLRAQISNLGFYLGPDTGNQQHAWFTTGDVRLRSSYNVMWNSSASAYGASCDAGITRNAAGVVEINNGTPGTLRDLKARKASLTGLPTSASGLSAGDLWSNSGVVNVA